MIPIIDYKIDKSPATTPTSNQPTNTSTNKQTNTSNQQTNQQTKPTNNQHSHKQRDSLQLLGVTQSGVFGYVRQVLDGFLEGSLALQQVNHINVASNHPDELSQIFMRRCVE